MRADHEPSGRSAPTERTPRHVFRREGEYWTVEYAGMVTRLRDSTGLRHLACLLGRAGERVPSIELLASTGRRAPEWREAAPACFDARDIERARVTVTRAIRAALRRLGENHPALLEHLKATIRTGTACAYEPDPRLPVRWEL